MSAFSYEALNAAGRPEQGVLEGDSARQVRGMLRERGLTPLRVEAVQATQDSARRAWFGQSISTAQLALTTRQFATLLAAGLTIEQSLNALIEQAEHVRLRQILAGLRTGVLSGQSLAAAMRPYDSAFPELYRTLVSAGEDAGKLDQVMLSLADYTEERHALRQKILQAMIYPILVTLVALCVVIGLLTSVVPQVVRVFESTHQALPWLTRALIHSSDFLRATGLWWLAGLLLFSIFANRLLRQEQWRWRRDVWLLRLPLVGRILRDLNATRLASTLAILTGGGVPLLKALEAADGVMTSLPMRRAVEQTQREVREGGSLYQALKRSGQFPPMMLHLINSGESSGQLVPLLDRAAKQLSRELEGWINSLTRLLEPLMIVVMGAVVLIIVLAILLPILEMNQIVR